MILWLPLGKCSGSSFAGVGVSQAPGMCFSVPMDLQAFSLSTASLTALVSGLHLPFLTFLPSPSLHILTLTRQTL